MPVVYMIVWSVIMLLAFGILHLRSLKRLAVATAVTAFVILFSGAMFSRLSATIGVDPNLVMLAPNLFIWSGPIGWLALIILPFGWLAPIVGLQSARWINDGAIG